jgi:hypothetical protein
MIVFDLSCPGGHRFEGWFSSSQDYEAQLGRGLVQCPHCGSAEVAKAPMAPAVSKKGNQQIASAKQNPQPAMGGQEMPQEVAEAMAKIAEFQREAIKTSEWVGDKFAEKSRAIHYGESDAKPIHGRATQKETKELLEEGIKVAPLLFPFAPPDEVN